MLGLSLSLPQDQPQGLPFAGKSHREKQKQREMETKAYTGWFLREVLGMMCVQNEKEETAVSEKSVESLSLQTGGESNGLINVRVSYEHALCLMYLRQSVVKS